MDVSATNNKSVDERSAGCQSVVLLKLSHLLLLKKSMESPRVKRMTTKATLVVNLTKENDD